MSDEKETKGEAVVTLQTFLLEKAVTGTEEDCAYGLVMFEIESGALRYSGQSCRFKMTAGGHLFDGPFELYLTEKLPVAIRQSELQRGVQEYVMSAIGPAGWAIRSTSRDQVLTMLNNWFSRTQSLRVRLEESPTPGW